MRKSPWTLEKTKQGFERFFDEHSHYPTWLEINDYEYLPNTRTIQRQFGGLSKLREALGLEETHLGKGEARSKIANKANRMGRIAENELEDILVEHFGKIFVHIEKPIFRDSKSRFDFFVYADGIEFGVDVFYSETRHDIMKNLNFKIESYKKTSALTYFVLGNKDIEQKDLDNMAQSKTKPLLQHMKLVSWDKFIDIIKTIEPLSVMPNKLINL